MYQPKRYQKNDRLFTEKLIRENPFAEFILQGERLLATHIPVLMDEESDNLRLFAHIANHNPQKKYLQDGVEALLIFRGADAYVSSSWYAQKDISTWDYSAVHIQCKLKIQDTAALVKSLKLLVHHFERGEENPLEFNHIPDSIIASNLPEITGFWCEPILVEGVGKWHQGFDKKDVSNIIFELGQKSCPHHKLITELKKEHDL